MSDHKDILRMLTPAGWWRDAFPVGNGTIGAMPYGRIANERILINHERLWYGGTVDKLPDISAALPRLRELMRQGDYTAANDLYQRTLEQAGYQGNCAMYHPAGDLLIDMPVNQPFRDYGRSLDMSSAITETHWNDGEITFSRDVFVSRADDTIAIRIRASHPGSINANIRLAAHDLNDAEKPPDIAFSSSATANEIRLCGRYTRENGKTTTAGREFGILGRVFLRKGELKAEGDTLVVKQADEVLIRLKVFVYENPGTAFQRLSKELAETETDFITLSAAHMQLHRKLYNRTTFELDTPTSNTPNETLLLQAYDGKAPLELVEKMANYGRYLLICSSRPGGLPSNLQGIWNGDYQPPWLCFFMINENLQMNYWQALPGQLPEMLLAVVDFYTAFLEDFRENARKLYGCDGIFIPALISPETGLSTFSGSWIINWISGAGWLAQHIYDYYQFTGDRDFLTRRAMPFMKEIIDFYQGFLEEENGELRFCPSVSPENWPIEFNAPELQTETSGTPRVTVNSLMDVAVAKEVLRNMIAAVQETGLYGEKLPEWQQMLDKMPPYRINSDGAICEWLHNDFSDNYHHRHQSHLYPVFPGQEIDPVDGSELAGAFKTAVDKRLVIGLGQQTGWSLAHMANINARFGDSDTAAACFDLIAQCCLGKNFFTYHNDYRGMGITMNDCFFNRSTPFQIDANMGLTAAVYEMLLYSAPGRLRLLPALPERWRKGRITNLGARGRITVSISWDLDAGQIDYNLHSQCQQEVEITCRKNPVTHLELFDGNRCRTISGTGFKLTLNPKVNYIITQKLKP